MLYDITPAITPNLSVWPGDTPMSREMLMDIAKGDSVTLSTLRATVHLGAHADGPNHYARNGTGIGERPLRFYMGPCRVISAKIGRGERVRTDHLAIGDLDDVTAHRVLIKTGTFPDPNNWNSDFAALDPALVEAFARKGVLTIGVDTPSVDLQDSKDLPSHAAFARHDMAILEGLRLEAVPDGEYELIALPLKLLGFDASPVRAVLRTIEHPLRLRAD
jgi:arylformamidase